VAGRRVDVQKRRQWRALIARQRTSGLSIRAFCAGERISEPSFYAWRRTLTRERLSTAARSRPRPQAATFLPLTLAPSSAAPAYELFLPGGARVLVYPPAGERLADVLAALEKPAC
jgi:hypothetical protein